MTSFSPKVAFSYRDLATFLRFLSIPFRKRRPLVFVTGRQDMLRFVAYHFKGVDIDLYVRSETVRGDSFFIECFRFIFRKTFWLVFFKDYRRLLCSLYKIRPKHVDNESVARQVKAIIGDYFFNYILRFFFKDREVYFSNCVVPQIERYQNLLNSCEIQHGVIHSSHLDYAKIPNGLFKTKLLAWNNFWEKVIIEKCMFKGAVISSDYEPIFQSSDGFSFDVLIYTTVDDEFSKKIENIDCNSSSQIIVQKHPRDYYRYEKIGGNVRFGYGVNALKAEKVVVSDSTLIRKLNVSGKFFYYMMAGEEEREEVARRLMSKYDVKIYQDYEIIESLNDIM
ncbi:hypothetical protein EBB56_11795 [Halomonas sp. YLB-10]|uniref:hypothetical protein n=1 Tax=Halomonas sp. YLB-10 TaxID=2483111 RepID=UPI000F5F98B8|nr:hypothetical protein [Halomonas sp. YLB-10]RQW70849.1 hypothetical protein EBB56_11795 [Halomonas sp. YLB-10]